MSDGPHLPHDWYPRPLPVNVSLGEGSWLYSSFAFIHFRSHRAGAVRIGEHSGVYHGSFFDLGPYGEIEIGEYCTLVGVIVASNGRVRIGNASFLAHEVVIADEFAPRPWASEAVEALQEPEESVVLGENVWVGAGAVLLKGARLGDDCIVGAGCVVDFEVPAGSIVGGNPARVVGDARKRG